METVGFDEVVGPEHQLLGLEEAQRAALMYISLGWGVVVGPGIDGAGVCWCGGKGSGGGAPNPGCRNPGKHAFGGWGNAERRVMNADQAENFYSAKNKRWADGRPVDQLFIVPYLSGLIVADVDNMDAWGGLGAAERPETLWASSGSGRGGHYLYKYDWGWEGSGDLATVAPSMPGKLLGGAGEIKFRGIIAAPPSVHKSGGRYAWANWGAEIADAPKNMVERYDALARTDYDWAKIEVGEKDNWTANLFMADHAGIEQAGLAKTSRPLVLFAVAATMGVWVANGWITEDQVVSELLEAANKNGALDDYGEHEIVRQIKNGIVTGIREKK